MRRLFRADAAAAQDTPPRENAGATLRAARLALGQQLPDVASMLRIRLPYLQAIEDGRYDDLPGAAYAAGFLRSYAEHVGLDPEAMVRRYKEEMAGRNVKQELYLPTPAAEGRMPGGALLFGALVLAGAVYGGWYYMSATDRSIVDLTPALPDRLVALMEGLPWRSSETGTVEAPPEPPPPAAVAPLPAIAPSTPAIAPAAPAIAPAASIAARPSPPAPAAAPPSPPPAPVSPPPVAGGQRLPSPPPPVAAAREEPEEEAEGSVQEPTPLAPNAGPLTPSPAGELSAPSADLAAATGKVYGAQNGGSRIQLRATQETWLQVRDRSGEFLLTRTLKPGDVYRAPDRPGLRVRTGNAGGLVVITDGVAGPPLGAVGQVLRDVPLEAPSLRGAVN